MRNAEVGNGGRLILVLPALIRYDSTYAANIVTGQWRARANKGLAARIRSLWATAHDHLSGQLWASHVYGHSGHKWNDRADELARRGKGGAPAQGRRRLEGMDEYEDDNYMNGQIENEQVRA